ncbi:hypothetical protein TNCV_3157031 [Trichonephila clavipes]|nr:hypothetical protein TNCV_3157031 [Trichonephila clavipes]
MSYDYAASKKSLECPFGLGAPGKIKFQELFLIGRAQVPSSGEETESPKNITARVIERDTSGEIYYFPEDSRGFRTHQHGLQSPQIGRQK